MSTRPHLLRRAVWLWLGAVLLACASVRADVEFTDPLSAATLWTASGADVESTPLSPGADAPTGVPATAPLAPECDALSAWSAHSATPWDPSPHAEAVEPAKPPTRLFDNESSGLLMFQSLFLVGLIRGRRRWAAALLAVAALSRSGLTAITEWVGLPKARAATTAPPPEAPSLRKAYVGLPSAPPERSYAGLLRRLDGDLASATRGGVITQSDQEPATRLASRVAGLVVPAALTSPAASIPPANSFAFLPSEGRASLSLQTLSFARFARPPPATA